MAHDPQPHKKMQKMYKHIQWFYTMDKIKRFRAIRPPNQIYPD